jgi:hypothetical protein
MASLDWHLTRTDGVTLVELIVTGGPGERIRVESNLEPVWPPRRQGVPAAGWDGAAFTGTVDAGEQLVVGYATPAEPVEPPATLAPPRDPGADRGVDARDLIRTLGDPRPVGAAVRPDSQGTLLVGSNRDDTVGRRSAAVTTTPTTGTQSDDLGVEAWFGAVERRLDTAETLTSVTDAAEAQSAVASVGGIPAVRELAAAIESDRRRLGRLRGRIVSLDEHVRAVDVPVETLERLA